MPSERSLELFRKVAQKLPAYRNFLKAHDYELTDKTDLQAYENVPFTTKKNYLTTNKTEDLVWGEALQGPLLFCATSGSTGEPYYFPRNEKLSWQYSCMVEEYLRQSSYGTGRTLVLLGFGMGVWIGGVITLRAFEIAAQRMNYPLSILPTGYNKVEIFKAIKRLSAEFDQTIIIGYPPFIKELVDEAPRENIDLKQLHIRFLFAAEAFTETFRNYVCEQAGITNPIQDTLNIYGSADIGAMAYETPLSILIRRLALEDPSLYKDLFGQIEKTPTLVQYNPDFIEFEEVNGELILTADGALPLIRYAIGDHGGVFAYTHVRELFQRYGIDLEDAIDKAGIGSFVNRDYPFVHVYERKDLSITLHGILIYPEYIKEGLLNNRIRNYFTQRFTMSTKTDIQHNQFIQVNIELHKDIKPSKELEEQTRRVIIASMRKKSSEFTVVANARNATELVQVVFWPNGHKRYFAPGTKQKWVEKP